MPVGTWPGWGKLPFRQGGRQYARGRDGHNLVLRQDLRRKGRVVFRGVVCFSRHPREGPWFNRHRQNPDRCVDEIRYSGSLMARGLVQAAREVFLRGDMMSHRHGRLIRLGIFFIVALLSASAGVGAGIQAEFGTENRHCLRCHRMQTLAYRDPTTGAIIDLYIDPKGYDHSVHGAMACVDCHEGGFNRYPHPREVSNQRLTCLGCHREDERISERNYRFKTIRDEFHASVHARSTAPEAQGFDCHRCHDAHVFRNAEIGQPLAEIVRADNRLCLSCHQKIRQPESRAHLWLPKRDKHWAAVRCLECHTPLTPADQPVSHQILAAQESNTDCVDCHSKEPRLLNRLYRYRAESDMASRGLWSQTISNESYVVGMSRSPLLDRLGLGLIGLSILGLGAHGWGRYLAYRRLKGR